MDPGDALVPKPLLHAVGFVGDFVVCPLATSSVSNFIVNEHNLNWRRRRGEQRAVRTLLAQAPFVDNRDLRTIFAAMKVLSGLRLSPGISWQAIRVSLKFRKVRSDSVRPDMKPDGAGYTKDLALLRLPCSTRREHPVSTVLVSLT